MENFWMLTIISSIIIIVLFFILRELFCWYWKINERITHHTETNNLLKDLINLLSNNTELNEINRDPKVINEELTIKINNNEFMTFEELLIFVKKMELGGILLNETNLQFIVSKYGLTNIKVLKDLISATLIN